jgi:hypothetical protein
MSDTTTTNTSVHAPAARHAFLDEIKAPHQKLLARKADELKVEQKTAAGIEAALNSLEDIPGIPGKLHFKVSVSEEGYQVHAKLEKHIITL